MCAWEVAAHPYLVTSEHTARAAAREKLAWRDEDAIRRRVEEHPRPAPTTSPGRY